MFISERSIQQVRDSSITQVVSQYVKLKTSGAKATGLCPFHNEKSPSFSVSENKGIYKCFGCGAGGDAIKFVQLQDKLEFQEAIEKIAAINNIKLDYEEVADKEKYQSHRTEQQLLKDVMQYAVEFYKNNLWNLPADHPVVEYLAERKITKEVIAEWQLGWAPEDWHVITPELISKGWHAPATKLGLIKRSLDNERNFDGYRSRITIPITNRHGEYIGLGGRFFEIDEADKGKKYPKYINPPENELYSKSNVLFGLSQADKAITKEGFASLVEGYFDVITPHAHQDANMVATCGTALTLEQAQLLRKYTGHVVVFRDADAAGRAAAVKDLYILIKAGFKVEIALLPEGEDPDSYSRKITTSLYKDSDVKIEDGIRWQVNNLVKDVLEDDHKLGDAKQNVLDLLLNIPNEITRNNYFDSIVKKYKWNRQVMLKQLVNLQTERDAIEEDDGKSMLDKMPGWMSKKEFEEKGYCSVNNSKRTGYYSYNGTTHTELTNFLIHPLFHIYAGKDSRHLIQIDNGKKKAVIDIESKALTSPDLLQVAVVNEGAFVIYGAKAQMLRIATQLLGEFPKCIEIKFLGWQAAGFFAFVDKIFIPGQGLQDLNEWGILKYKPIGKDEVQNYLVPAASAAYAELQSTGEDPYETDRVFPYVKSALTFKQWAEMMNRVYGDKGPVGIAYAILSLFRDVIFDIDNNCPHLYAFGEKSSGKSKWGESIAALFFVKRAAFNLNSGTDHAFFSYMSRFINCPALMNEFDEKVLKPEWFQAIKGVYDGEGRQRGVMGSKNRIEIQKVRSSLVLMGQWLCTMDDNSIVSRSLIEGFNEVERTEADKESFIKLKGFEEVGLTSILVELMEHRVYFKEKYRDAFNETLSNWRLQKHTDGRNERIMQNWCHLFTCWQVLSTKVLMPVTLEFFENYCLKKAMYWSRFIKSSDTLSEFWNTVAFLVDQGTLIAGWDYKIAEVFNVTIRKDRSEEYTQTFTEPTKIIYIRMNNVHKHYQLAYRTRTGKEGMTMENLMHYFSSRKYYIGSSKQSEFKKWVYKTEPVKHQAGLNVTTRPETSKVLEKNNTSSYVFLYTELGIDIERTEMEEHQLEGAGHSNNGQELDLPF